MAAERTDQDFRYCPECGAEYLADVERCYDCDAALVDELPEDEDAVEDHDAPRLVEVFSASHVEAELVRAALEGHGLKAVMARPDQSSAYPLTVGAMGEGRVLVPEEEGQQALEIIGSMDDYEEDEPEIFAERTSKEWTWWVALIVSIALILLLVVEIRY